MNNRLILMMDKQNIEIFLKTVPLIFGGGVFLYVMLGILAIPAISALLRGLVIFGLIMMLFTAVYAMWTRNDDLTAAILDENGIWLPRHGLIYWDEIKDVVKHRTPSAPMEYVGIWLHHPAKIANQSTFAGKMVLFWSSIFPYPHIQVSNITTDVDVVVRFAQHYLSRRVN